MVALVILFFFDPATTPIYPSCLSQLLADRSCATCGGLRAMHHLLHGRVAGAWALNPLMVVMTGAMALEGLRTWIWGKSEKIRVALLVAGLIALAVF